MNPHPHNPNIASREEWLTQRINLLQKEKQLTSQLDQLAQQRRQLPWVKVQKQYNFHTSQGTKTLQQLFNGKSQLIIYHFMFGPQWKEGCPSCSFWADNFNGTDVHLANRDINFIAVSRAPLDKIQQYKNRMGWNFQWVSSIDDFNFDYNASFNTSEGEKSAEGEDQTVNYNYKQQSFPSEEAPAISVFYKNEQGEVFHTYACYARGLDLMNAAYQYMDLTPKGRDEDQLPFTMAWLQRRDQYADTQYAGTQLPAPEQKKDASFSDMLQEEKIQYAGFWLRAFATFIDTMLFMLIITPILIFTYGGSWITDDYVPGTVDYFLTYILPPIIVLLFWFARQATPGKMIASIKIVDATTKNPPTKAQYIIRYLGYYVSTLPLFLGFLWIVFDKRNQSWHDKIANTLVIQYKKR